MVPISPGDRGANSELALARTLYRLVLQHPTWTAGELAAAAGIPTAQVELLLENLEGLELLATSTTARGGYSPVDPEVAVLRLMAAEERKAAAFQHTLKATRESIQTIVADFMAIRSEKRESVSIEIFDTTDQVNVFLYDALSTVRSHECTMHPGGIPPVELLDDMLLRDKAAVDQGIQIRTLYERHIAEVDYVADYLTEVSQLGMDVRLTDHLPMRMMIFDDDRVLVPINPKVSEEGALAVRGAELVRSFQTFFDFCWHNALSWSQVTEARSLNITFSPQERLILHMLASGAKDEVIARRLGVSTRTLSRMISNLLERLGVQSRFQAALKVAAIGGFH
ncbi:DNA-binding CsgD family transcriptional regulator/sugar-specific transcriptional regulator TrmB [Streptacidiphilus sp. MAP12-33]|uniref:LuxR C-terminal-related transcriptional regulator n=1 Tax=Streptacidiphilus sp. MAP12-33 TaxID=3156266 RepID=UPI003515502F